MTLSPYHKKYANQTDVELQNRINEKDKELETIFNEIKFQPQGETVKVGILGCGDKRFVKAHKLLFEKYVHKPIELTTFDITIEHLKGEENTIQHDCTLALPYAPYDITYAHVVLRFVETEKQWDFIINSYEALKDGGLAMHFLDTEDYGTSDVRLSNGLYSVPLFKWKEKLNSENISCKEIPLKYGLALVLIH